MSLLPAFQQTRRLLDDRSYTSGSYGVAALTNSEGKSLLHSDRMDQLDGHLDVITRHAHLSAFRKSDNTGNIGCSEIELRTIVIEERGMTAALILCQNVNLSGELCVAGNGAGLCDNLSLLDIGTVDTTKKDTDVITSLCIVQESYGTSQYQ
jgi:hypothetical protein